MQCFDSEIELWSTTRAHLFRSIELCCCCHLAGWLVGWIEGTSKSLIQFRGQVAKSGKQNWNETLVLLQATANTKLASWNHFLWTSWVSGFSSHFLLLPKGNLMDFLSEWVTIKSVFFVVLLSRLPSLNSHLFEFWHSPSLFSLFWLAWIQTDSLAFHPPFHHSQSIMTFGLWVWWTTKAEFVCASKRTLMFATGQSSLDSSFSYFFLASVNLICKYACLSRQTLRTRKIKVFLALLLLLLLCVCVQNALDTSVGP